MRRAASPVSPKLMKSFFSTKPPLTGGSASFWSRDAIVAPADYNRWNMAPAAILTHLSIGSVYSWSLFNEPLARSLGVVAASSADWGLSSVVPVFSATIGVAGLTAALSGPWAEKFGPRSAVLVAGMCWGSGLVLGGLGVSLHMLPLVYLGYGLVGGLGVGLAYGPPVATLMRWFPDRRGLASGMAIMGFGGGALVASPLIRAIQEHAFVAPTYLGSAAAVKTVFAGGKRMTEDGALEVVLATARDIKSMGMSPAVTAQLQEGVYVVGTGNNGAAHALLVLGAVYGAAMLGAGLMYKVPREGWTPTGYASVAQTPGDAAAKPAAAAQDPLVLPAGHFVPLQLATRTPQFYQIWTSLFLNATAGIAVLGVAKTLMSDVFGGAMPTVVDAAFCAGYVGALSAFNGVGRLAWAAASDRLGRKATFSTYFVLGIPLYLSIPVAAHMAGTSPGVAPLVMFTASTLSIITMYGGGFSVAPAYLADIFGSKDVGAIYGRLLTAWAAAGLTGPTLLSLLRRRSEVDAIRDLAAKVDPAAFAQQFGSPVGNLQSLIDANTVSIAKLLAMSPSGTVDPTPFLYDSTMKTMACLLGVGLASNLMMKPVDPKLISTTTEKVDSLH